MAGTLVSSVLSDGVNSTSTTNAIQGSAKAWVTFYGGYIGTAGVIRGSYNVSSITVNGTGDYRTNFTAAMPNTNYAVAISFVRGTGVAQDYGTPAQYSPDSTSYCRIFMAGSTGTGGITTGHNSVIIYST